MLTLLGRHRCFGALMLSGLARGVPSSRTLESCVHSRSGVCVLPTCVEKPAAVIAKKTSAISSDTRICASSRDNVAIDIYWILVPGRQIARQYWHFQLRRG